MPTSRHTADMVRDDLAQAQKEATEPGGIVIEVHSPRHAFRTCPAAALVPRQVIQKIMRHSAITLTMDRETPAFKSDETEAVGRLPGLDQPDRVRDLMTVPA
ncbi:MAG: hypothetical protein OER86_11600 [Phycisphaerae bacterium]|nr:hypothetical protein [Phycisphaerae bacterium]